MLFDLSHSISIVVAATIGYFFGYVDLGAVLMMVFFVGRELTQAEYKWIQRYGQGKRRNMPWWGSLDYRVWDTHSFWWNTTLPLIVCIIIVLI
jgi:hypothetical protein